MDFYDSQYGLWRSVMDGHEYHDLSMNKIISMGVFNPRPGRAKEKDRVTFLRPVDDFPPSTVITHVLPGESSGRVLVKGAAIDDYDITRVVVNGREAKPIRPNFSEWEIEVAGTLDGPLELEARAEDSAGNVEKRPHRLRRPVAKPQPAAAATEGHKAPAHSS